MPYPLQKRTRKGRQYERLPHIEQAIDAAVQQDDATLSARALLPRGADDYLPNECLVYLIREANRLDNRRRLATLVSLLIRRCTANLNATVSSNLAGAPQLREDIVGQLLELIAADGTAKDKLKLDFFEVRFDRAFQKLRIDWVRKQLTRSRVEKPRENLERLSGARNDERDVEVDINLVADHLHVLTQDERTAFGLKYVEGLVEYSKDPEKPTIAKLMGKSDRMVRNYLKSAKEKLRAAMEEKQ